MALAISRVWMRGRGEVTNEEWAVLEPLLRFRQRPDGRGRRPQDTVGAT